MPKRSRNHCFLILFPALEGQFFLPYFPVRHNKITIVEFLLLNNLIRLQRFLHRQNESENKISDITFVLLLAEVSALLSLKKKALDKWCFAHRPFLSFGIVYLHTNPSFWGTVEIKMDFVPKERWKKKGGYGFESNRYLNLLSWTLSMKE